MGFQLSGGNTFLNMPQLIPNLAPRLVRKGSQILLAVPIQMTDFIDYQYALNCITIQVPAY
jgi:hypothetical protein